MLGRGLQVIMIGGVAGYYDRKGLQVIMLGRGCRLLC